jgi:hypothetical protein
MLAFLQPGPANQGRPLLYIGNRRTRDMTDNKDNMGFIGGFFENEHPEAQAYHHAHASGHFNWTAARQPETSAQNDNGNKPAAKQQNSAPKR